MGVAEQLRRLEARCELEDTLANDVVEPAGRPNDDDRLQEKCDLAELWAARSWLVQPIDAAAVKLLQRATVPGQPISPGPGRPVAIGMLVGLLASAVLVWWRTRRQGPPSGTSASEQGPEMPSPA